MLRELLSHPGVSEILHLRGPIGLMAFHGGNLERTTDVVAREVADRTGSSLYAVLQEPPLRRHLPSTAFLPEHSSSLAAFLGHVDVAIAIHGYGRENAWHHLLLGGRNRDLARHLAGHLEQGLPDRYQVIDDLDRIPRELRGQHRDNPVNRPAATGVQLELPPTIRWNRAEKNWSDHLGTGRTEEIDMLIESLTAGVETWPGAERERPTPYC